MPAPRTTAPPAYQSTQPPQQEHRTEPRRRSSTSFQAFTPAQRVSSQPPRRVFQEEPEDEQEVEIINAPQQSRVPSFRPSQMPQGGNGPLTKSGYPDRRFRGQRDLPPPEPEQDQMQRARTGGVIGNMHVTIEGKPDRRFKENRGLSDEEVMARWAEEVQQRFGRKR
jgi:hypothetical protein